MIFLNDEKTTEGMSITRIKGISISRIKDSLGSHYYIIHYKDKKLIHSKYSRIEYVFDDLEVSE